MNPEEQNMMNPGGAAGATPAGPSIPLGGDGQMSTGTNPVDPNSVGMGTNLGGGMAASGNPVGTDSPISGTTDVNMSNGDMNPAMNNDKTGMTSQAMASGLGGERSMGTSDSMMNANAQGGAGLADTTFTPVTAGADPMSAGANEANANTVGFAPVTNFGAESATSAGTTDAPQVGNPMGDTGTGFDPTKIANAPDNAATTNNPSANAPATNAKKKITTPTIILMAVAGLALIGVIVLLVLTNI